MTLRQEQVVFGLVLLLCGSFVLTATGPSKRRNVRTVHLDYTPQVVPEATRALSFAMPLLEKAQKVTLLAADPIEPPEIPAEEGVERLAWYGVSADVVRFDVRAEEIGAGYLNHASRLGADLLIKGAYARHRLRQMILGGRTRHIITHAEIPVVLCN